MSADASYNILQSHTDGHIALPQPVGDLSLIDSVTGFIQEAYVNVLPAETKLGDKILWAKFVPCEAGPDVDNAPLILVLAYSTGVQAWRINSKGEAKEVLSWHQGIVKAIQFLPCPSFSQWTGCDMYMLKRPLVALCDNGGPSPPFHNVTFLSLATGEQVKHIKFKNEVCEILANKKCVIVTFLEKIAIFDACSLEDKFTITTCYPSPGIKCNPVSLGSRWLAFADARILSLCRSYGGYEGEGAVSYTASVLQAAKSLSKGLRDLSGSVAHSLTGSGHTTSIDVIQDTLCPGIVTVLDIESKPGEARREGSIVAHFVAHTTPIVALSFDPTGLLLLTAEKRGHKFNLFKIEPSKSGSSHAYVHHLYILHRGDTTARVQDISFSSDSRWVAVSSLRGTTHVFPITMYGGGIGLRTHTTSHVVNRLSRFHKSAGITPLSPSPPNTKSPLSNVSSSPDLSSSPSSLSLPHLSSSSPLVLTPLAQIRRQLSNSTTSNNSGITQRHHSTDDSSISVKVAACFSSLKCSNVHSHNNHIVNKTTRKSSAPSLFLITGHGYLIQYDLEPRPIAGLTKDKLCDDTPIDLHVEPYCQWRLFYPPTAERISRVHSDLNQSLIPHQLVSSSEHSDKWLSQVEIITHAGPHRRLWMGPQFSFKTYTPPSSGLFSFDNIVTSNVTSMPVRSTPMNIEKSKSVPVLIETISTGSADQSPRFMEELEAGWGEHMMGESQLCEDLADAMQETHGAASTIQGSKRVVWVTEKGNQRQLPSYQDMKEVFCKTNTQPTPLSVYVSRQEEVNKKIENSLNMVDDMFGGEDEREMKKNKSMEKDNQKQRNISREEKEAVKGKEQKEMISLGNFVELNSGLKVMELKQEAGNSSYGEGKKKTKKSKKSKNMEFEANVVEVANVFDVANVEVEANVRNVANVEVEANVLDVANVEVEANVGKIANVEVEAHARDVANVEVEANVADVSFVVNEIEDVDEDLFKENIDIEQEKKLITSDEPKQKESDQGVRNEEDRYENIEPERRYADIEICNNLYGQIEIQDGYEESFDDMEPGYQYEEDYDPYEQDENNDFVQDKTENVANVYVQGSLGLSECPPLMSEFPAIPSFERSQTPTSGLIDNGLVDSGCGLKKRKNKKKKR